MERKEATSIEVLSPLREARIDDVFKALSTAAFSRWPQDEEDLLKFFGLMLTALKDEGCIRSEGHHPILPETRFRG